MKKKLAYLLLLIVLIPTIAFAATKITELTEDTAPVATDLLVTVDNPGGTPVTKKATIANVAKGMTSTNLIDTADILYEGELDSFSELDSQIADQTLIHSGSNIATATALAANGGNCSAGSAPLGVDASGAVETCTDYEEDLSNEAGLYSALSDVTNFLQTGDALAGDDITDGTVDDTELAADSVGESELIEAMNFTPTGAWNYGGATLEVPNSATLPGTCTVGMVYMDTDATSGQRIYACESTNTWALQGDGGGGGGDSISIDSSAVVDPDFVSTGDIDFVDTSNTVTANINAGSIIETDLDGDVDPVDGDFLQYDSTGTNFTWRSASETLSDIGAEGTLTNEAGLYSALSDVTNFLQTGDALAGDDITDGTVDETELAANSVDSSELVDGSVDLSHMSSASVDSDNIVDATIVVGDLVADTITYAGIADASQNDQFCVVIETPVDADDLIIYRFNQAATITGMDCIVEDATSAVLVLVECDSAGANCGTSRFTESVTCDTDGATDDGVAETGVVAGGLIRGQVGTVTGTPGHVMACLSFTWDD